MERLIIIPYKGKEIVSIDYRGLNDEEEFLKFANQTADFLIGLNRPSLQMTNIEGIFFTPKLMKAVQDDAPRLKPYILKDAILGVLGVKRILFQLYSTLIDGKTKTFSDEYSAKEWLVKDA